MIHKKIALFCFGALISLYNCDNPTNSQDGVKPLPPNDVWVIVQLDKVPRIGETAVFAAKIILNNATLRAPSKDSTSGPIVTMKSIRLNFRLTPPSGMNSDSGFVFNGQQHEFIKNVQEGDSVIFQTQIKAIKEGRWPIEAVVIPNDSAFQECPNCHNWVGGFVVVVSADSSYIEQYFGTYYQHLKGNQLGKEN